MPHVAAVVAPYVASAVLGVTGSATAAAIAGNFVAGMMFAGVGFAAGAGTLTSLAILGGAAQLMGPKIPKLDASTNGQLLPKLDGVQSPVPVVFGRTAVAGNIVYRQAYGGTGKNEHLAMVRVLGAGGPYEGWEKTYAGDFEVVLDGDPHLGLKTCTGVVGAEAGSKLYKDKLKLSFRYGWAPDSGSQFYMDPTMPYYTAESTLSGLCNMGSVMIYDPEAFPQSAPRLTDVIKGLKVYDPRNPAHDPDDASSFTWSENPYLIALDFVRGRWENGEKVYGMGTPWELIDVDSFIEGANYADDLDIKCGGQYSTGDDPFAVLTNLLKSGLGDPVHIGAVIGCHVTAPKTAIYTITEADVIGQKTVTNTTRRRDKINTIRGSYRFEGEGLWEMHDAEPVTGSTYLEEDGGIVRSRQITYPFCQDPEIARKLMAADLCNAREALTITLTARPRLLGVRVGDAVLCDFEDDIGTAEGGQKFIVVERSFDPASLEVTLKLRAETDGKHAFILGQVAEPPGSPGLGGFDPTNPPTPSAPWAITAAHYTEKLPDGTDGASYPAIVIEGAPTDNPNAAEVVVEYVEDPDGGTFDPATAVWIQHAATPAATARKFVINRQGRAGIVHYAAVSYKTVQGITTPRLVLGPVTPSHSTLPWNPDVITGGPITNTGGIIANAVEWWNGQNTRILNEVLQRLEDDLQTVSNTANTVSNTISTIDAVLVQNTANTVNAIQNAITLVSPTAGSIGQRVLDGQAISNGIALRVSGLESVVGNTSTTPGSLRARVTAVETAETSNATAAASRLSSIESSVFNTANTGGIIARVISAETTITNLPSTYAAASSFNALSSEITTARNGYGNLGARFGSFTGTVADQLNGKASTTALSSLQSEITTARNGYSNLNARIDDYEETTTNALAGKASTTSVSSIQSEITAARQGAASLNAKIGTVSGTIADALNGKASASSVSTLSSTVGSHTSSISTIQSTLNGQLSKWSLLLNGSGAIASIQATAGSSTSSLRFLANEFTVVTTANGSPTIPFNIIGSQCYLSDTLVDGDLLVNGTIHAQKIEAAGITEYTANTVDWYGHANSYLDATDNEIVVHAVTSGDDDVMQITWTIHGENVSGSDMTQAFRLTCNHVELGTWGVWQKATHGYSTEFTSVHQPPANQLQTFRLYSRIAGASSGITANAGQVRVMKIKR